MVLCFIYPRHEIMIVCHSQCPLIIHYSNLPWGDNDPLFSFIGLGNCPFSSSVSTLPIAET
jgi:hypothetical protein